MKISILLIYLKAVLLGHKNIKGYIFKEIGNLPIVGHYFFKGYEIINPKIDKVVFRKVKHYGYVGSYIPKKHTIIKKFFPKNHI